MPASSPRRRLAVKVADLTSAPGVGQFAPSFSLRDQHGREQTLGQRRGRRHVLLVFYPFAFTGICTGELGELSEHASTWADLDTDVLAVSCDPLPSLRAFADSSEFDLPLLSDFWPHGAVASSYGAFDAELGAAGRSTYVIDRDGVVRWTVSSSIAESRSITDYLTALAEIS